MLSWRTRAWNLSQPPGLATWEKVMQRTMRRLGNSGTWHWKSMTHIHMLRRPGKSANLAKGRLHVEGCMLKAAHWRLHVDFKDCSRYISWIRMPKIEHELVRGKLIFLCCHPKFQIPNNSSRPYLLSECVDMDNSKVFKSCGVNYLSEIVCSKPSIALHPLHQLHACIWRNVINLKFGASWFIMWLCSY